MTGEDTPNADVVVRVLLRCSLPMPLTLTNVAPILGEGRDEIVFTPSSKVALLPGTTKAVDVLVRGRGHALGVVLQVLGVTAEVGKFVSLKWFVGRGRAGFCCRSSSWCFLFPIIQPALNRSLKQASVTARHGRTMDLTMKKMGAKDLLAQPWARVYNVLRVPLASTTSHVDFKLSHPSPPLLGETLDLDVTVTSNEDEVGQRVEKKNHEARM